MQFEIFGWSGASEASEAINFYILVRFCCSSCILVLILSVYLVGGAVKM
jgi:hypothetical protein